jgi:AcrR family transcriptional regulator
MQTQKNDIRETILEAAREEFLEQGFKETSMRTIA